MMKKLCIAIFISMVNFHVAAASCIHDTLIIGTWKGTSVCQVKNSPCHDETVVYHISKGTKPKTYRFVMNKIVNGKEEYISALEYTYDAAAGSLTSFDRIRKIIWNFKVKGGTMEGTQFFQKALYRIIKLTKDK